MTAGCVNPEKEVCMKTTFIIPPVFTKERPAERTAGCTTMVYPMPNMYGLSVAAVLENEGYTVCYEDFITTGRSVKAFRRFLEKDASDVYLMWSVNLSIKNDMEATLTLLTDKKQQQQLASVGKEFVREHYDWGLIAERLNIIYQELSKT
jgi:hypothetical protein